MRRGLGIAASNHFFCLHYVACLCTMTVTTTVVGFLILLPALAHEDDLASALERVRNIRDLQTLVEEIAGEQERAVLTIGIIPALFATAEIERFLARNEKFGRNFGTTAKNALHLVRIYLHHGKRK